MFRAGRSMGANSRRPAAGPAEPVRSFTTGDRASRRAGLLGCALVLVSCNEPSRLDHASDQTSGGPAGEDAWAARSAKPAKQDGDGKPGKAGRDRGLAGVDLQGMLAKVADNLGKPGPYEAPEQSQDLDETTPHWGVLS